MGFFCRKAEDEKIGRKNEGQLREHTTCKVAQSPCQNGTGLGLLLCGGHLEILHSWARGPVFSFCIGSSKLCSRSWQIQYTSIHFNTRLKRKSAGKTILRVWVTPHFLSYPTFSFRFWSHWEDWGGWLRKKNLSSKHEERVTWQLLTGPELMVVYYMTSVHLTGSETCFFFLQPVPTVILWAESSMYNQCPILSYSRVLFHGLTKLNSESKTEGHCLPATVRPSSSQVTRGLWIGDPGVVLYFWKCSPRPAFTPGI